MRAWADASRRPATLDAVFVGHAAVALAARPWLPRHSLGILFGATFFIDLLWPVMLLAGLEQVRVDPGNTAFTPLDFVRYPWSHSLAFVVGWGALVAWLAQGRRLGPARDFGLLALIVISHWVLDVVAHRPDLPVLPGGGPLFGLGLWRSVPATLLVEGAMFAVGIWLYVRSTPARDRIGTWALWSLVAFMMTVWIAQPLSAPPPSAQAVAVGALATWLLPLWAYWADRHRRLVTRESVDTRPVRVTDRKN